MRTAADAMITEMTVHPAEATVAELRELFGNERVHAALLADGGVLVAVVTRDDLVGAPEGPAAAVGRLGDRVVSADSDADDALQHLVRIGGRRLAVVGPEGRLVGLLCLKRSRTGFCTPHDLAARRADRTH